MYSQYQHIDWKNKLKILFQELNITRSDFISRLPDLTELYDGIISKNQTASEGFIEGVCEGFDVNASWMRGEVEDPILNSRTWIRSSDEEILSRVLLLQGTRTVGQFAAEIGTTVSMVNLILENKTRLTYKNASLIADACKVSTEWLIFGHENSREYPLNKQMHDYLIEHPEIRKMIWGTMKVTELEEQRDAEHQSARFQVRNPEKKINDSEWMISIRKRENLTQKQLAEILGVSLGLISLIETDRRSISEKLKKKMMDTFPELEEKK